MTHLTDDSSSFSACVRCLVSPSVDHDSPDRWQLQFLCLCEMPGFPLCWSWLTWQMTVLVSLPVWDAWFPPLLIMTHLTDDSSSFSACVRCLVSPSVDHDSPDRRQLQFLCLCEMPGFLEPSVDHDSPDRWQLQFLCLCEMAGFPLCWSWLTWQMTVLVSLPVWDAWFPWTLCWSWLTWQMTAPVSLPVWDGWFPPLLIMTHLTDDSSSFSACVRCLVSPSVDHDSPDRWQLQFLCLCEMPGFPLCWSWLTWQTTAPVSLPVWDAWFPWTLCWSSS